MIIFIELSKPSFVSVFILKFLLIILGVFERNQPNLNVFEEIIFGFFPSNYLLCFQTFSVSGSPLHFPENSP